MRPTNFLFVFTAVRLELLILASTDEKWFCCPRETLEVDYIFADAKTCTARVRARVR